MSIHKYFQHAADEINNADSLIIAAGAGIGIDSGLPDFRGSGGFWKAYPALAQAEIHFYQIANPDYFRTNSLLAWGFYGHRLNLYRQVIPHEGFSILKNIGQSMPHGMFVFTSNVDGQFAKAGFDNEQIHECHGSIHYMQCQNTCTDDIWSADDFYPQVDEENCLLISELPRCPHCGEISRPNVFMFGDISWLSHRADLQEKRLNIWKSKIERPIIIEIGAGDHIPTVKYFSEEQNGFLIRINPAAPEWNSPDSINFRMGGLEALKEIWRLIEE